MSLAQGLAARAADGRPIGVGVLGAGKFTTMFLAQVRRTPGLHVAAVADLDRGRIETALRTAGWPEGSSTPTCSAAALSSGGVFATEDSMAVIDGEGIEVVIDATGDPLAGIRHALACAEHGRHVIMVNVEADVLAGPLLAARARAAEVVYSLAYGDQPALIAELVDWARTAGFEVAAAGKGTKYLPGFHASTPETVWQHYGLTPEQAAAGGLNPKMFNSFLDGTKSAIEMAAVANATGLAPPRDGLAFPPCGVHDLPRLLKPRDDGGLLERFGQVEVVSSEERDGRHVVGDLRWGVYVTFRASSDYVARCFGEYGLITDPSGRYAAMWKPYHLIGLELGVTVASVVLRGEAIGQPQSFRADVVATAKRDLAAGEILDGEGGATVWGRLTPAASSLRRGALPIGLAHGVRLERPVAAGACVGWQDVTIDADAEAVRVRREMEGMAAGP